MTQIKNRLETFIGFLTFLSVLIRVIRVNLWLSFFFSQLVPWVEFHFLCKGGWMTHNCNILSLRE